MIRNKYVNNNISKKLLITNIVFTCAMMLIILLDYIFVCNREELNAKNLNVFRQNNIYESLNNETDRLKALCMELGNDSRVYSLVNLSAYNRNSFILDMKNKIDVISKSFPYKVDFLICTPKVRHFWRCIFLCQKEVQYSKNIVQNSK